MEREDSKVQQLIAKLGGWAGIALVSLAAFTYQGDKAATQQTISTLERSIAQNASDISQVRDTKLSKEEFKQAQDTWIRETAGMREDVRDLTKIIQRQLEKK